MCLLPVSTPVGQGATGSLSARAGVLKTLLMTDDGRLIRTRRLRPLLTRWLSLSVLAAACTGCATSAPVTIRQDRFNFNDAATESTKEQMLLNIVRLRYGETICFVDVSSMLSHYSFSAGGNLGGWHNNINAMKNPFLRTYLGGSDSATELRQWGANVDYTDSPTITYTPLSGDEFARRVMARIPTETILSLTESGWEIQRLMECCVQRINNVANKPLHEVMHPARTDYERFHKVTELLQAAQDADILRFAVERDGDGQVEYLYTPPVPADWQDTRKQFRELLDLPLGEVGRLKLTNNSLKREPDELAMQTRSVLGTMYALAQEVPIPDDQRSRGQPTTMPAPDAEQAGMQWLQVHHSRLPQSNAFVQVFHRGYWFYISDSDWSSKRTLSLLVYLFALQSPVKGQTGPLLTVSAGK
jgi:hypothetical protein